MKTQETAAVYPFRRRLIVFFFVLATGVLIWRGFYLQILNKEFLSSQGDARSLRVVTIPAHRGMITDRNNEPLAISTPVDSVWAIPRQVLEKPETVPELARLLGMEPAALMQMLKERIGREFVYLRRHIPPDLAQAVNALGIYGIYLQQEFRRYYPASEVTAHLVGFTNIDDSGQEGIELAFDRWLKGVPGAKRVLKDRLGRTIRDVESIRPASPGNSMALSIDRRVQYLAYRELTAAVKQFKAKSGTLVLMDSTTGEIISLVVHPSYNPNNRVGVRSENFRNRALTDIFEPGSTLKTFTAAAALMSGRYAADTTIDTRPGSLRVSNHLIKDISNFGVLDMTGIIQKSSNVGASKIGLALGPEPLWNLLRTVGFGEVTGTGFPGESPGMLANYTNWRELDLASISFGHGLAVTAVQLAQAYAVIASDGILRPVSLLKTESSVVGERVIPAEVTQQVRSMLESVVGVGGTGQRANVPFYHVAGKTGTAHKAVGGGYAESSYMSLFAGMAPASNPKLVLVIIIDEPTGGEHFGGLVAAPVFSGVMQGALRILDITPDNLPAAGTRKFVANQAADIYGRPR